MKRLAILSLSIFFTILVGCNTSNEKNVEAPQAAIITLSDGTYTVDTDASTLYWEAYKPIGGHMGGIKLKQGEVMVKNGQPSSGSFIIDMESITNTDIEDESMKTNLLNHLKSDDFFSVANYPTARFDITRVTPYVGEEDYDYTVEGDLSIKDVTDTITLLARVDSAGDQLSGFATTQVDRTKYDITIRSDSFFENLGDQLIKDEFTLEMDLVANRMQEGL